MQLLTTSDQKGSLQTRRTTPLFLDLAQCKGQKLGGGGGGGGGRGGWGVGNEDRKNMK